MIFGKKITSEQSIKLQGVLEAVLTYLKNSSDSVYAYDTVQECQDLIQKNLIKMKAGKRVQLKFIKYLFLPAGSLQDISLDNNWADEFLALSKSFDAIFSSSLN